MNSEAVVIIKKCPSSNFLKLNVDLVNEICGRNGPCFESHSKYWDINEWFIVKSHLQQLFTNYVTKNWTKDDLTKQVVELPEDYRASIQICLENFREELHRHLLNKMSQISSFQLKDFDWNLRLVMSSDHVATINKPLLATSFDLCGEGGNETVKLELTKEDVHKLLSSLESANKAMQLMRS